MAVRAIAAASGDDSLVPPDLRAGRQLLSARRCPRLPASYHRCRHRQLRRSFSREDAGSNARRCAHPVLARLHTPRLCCAPESWSPSRPKRCTASEPMHSMPLAVARIFEAKGRPASSPIIVHVSNMEMAHSVVAEWPPAAQALAQKFWPGPLTLVLKKQPAVPDSGNRRSRHRRRAHAVASGGAGADRGGAASCCRSQCQSLYRTLADNRRACSRRVSAIAWTTFSMAARAPWASNRPCCRWLSGTSRAACVRVEFRVRRSKQVIGPVALTQQASADAHPSPGMHPRHYSPRTKLLLVSDGAVPRAGTRRLPATECSTAQGRCERSCRCRASQPNTRRRFIARLHELDRERLRLDRSRAPERHSSEWEAVRDRLLRAVDSLTPTAPR